MSKIDLHLHSSYSDGSDSIRELAEKIKQAGITTFALTDHDTIAGCEEMAQLMPEGFIPGVELTTIAGNIKCHILGYKIDYYNPELLALIEKGKKLRRNKLETRIRYLKDTWNIELNKDELDWLYSRKSVVKTHIANILVKRGLAEDNQKAMKKYLDGCKAGDSRFTIEESIRTILNAGGKAIWAHPLGGEGERHLQPDEFLPKLKQMKDFGIQGLECYYSRYNQNEIEFLLNCAKTNNLIITGGSDYHGTNKSVQIGKLCADSFPIIYTSKNFYLQVLR
ncbi:PHP domain-containing protein [bacterium]|nr:PHP domain-containing protein [bacterium]